MLYEGFCGFLGAVVLVVGEYGLDDEVIGEELPDAVAGQDDELVVFSHVEFEYFWSEEGSYRDQQ